MLSRRRMLWAALAAPGFLEATPELVETEDNIEGPFYKAGAPWRNVLAEKSVAGTPLVVAGRVLDTSGKPIAGAVLDVWQADGEGRYDNQGYTLRGRFKTDAAGHYELITVMPRFYKVSETAIRPSHIHVKANSLTTQLYFEGALYNDRDRYVRRSLMLRPTDHGRAKRATFDFVLRPGT